MNELFTRQHQLKRTTSLEITRSKYDKTKSTVTARKKKDRNDSTKCVERGANKQKVEKALEMLGVCTRIFGTQESKEKKKIISPGMSTHNSSIFQ